MYRVCLQTTTTSSSLASRLQCFFSAPSNLVLIYFNLQVLWYSALLPLKVASMQLPSSNRFNGRDLGMIQSHCIISDIQQECKSCYPCLGAYCGMEMKATLMLFLGIWSIMTSLIIVLTGQRLRDLLLLWLDEFEAFWHNFGNRNRQSCTISTFALHIEQSYDISNDNLNSCYANVYITQ